MRFYKIAALCAVFCTLFTTIHAQPTEVNMKKLQGYYFSGSNAMLKPGVNCIVLQKAKDFEKFFGKNRSDTPNFSKEWMLILVMPATKKDIVMNFNRVSMKAGTFIEVYCDLNNLKGKSLTYETNPLVACTIPKSKGIRTVNFYEEGKKGELKLMEAVELKEEK